MVRSWAGGGQSEEKFEKQQRGIYEIDWDVENEIVMSEPFMSYVVHDAVALAGRAELLPDLYLRWMEFLKDGYDTIGEIWGRRYARARLELYADARHADLHAGRLTCGAGFRPSSDLSTDRTPGMGERASADAQWADPGGDVRAGP